jgi:hypothetical protein
MKSAAVFEELFFFLVIAVSLVSQGGSLPAAEASYAPPFISGLIPTVAACGDATAMPVLLSPHP